MAKGNAARTVVIDMGSNSFRLVVYDSLGERWWRHSDEIYDVVRIGAGLGETGRLSEGADRAGARGQRRSTPTSAPRVGSRPRTSAPSRRARFATPRTGHEFVERVKRHTKLDRARPERSRGGLLRVPRRDQLDDAPRRRRARPRRRQPPARARRRSPGAGTQLPGHSERLRTTERFFARGAGGSSAPPYATTCSASSSACPGVRTRAGRSSAWAAPSATSPRRPRPCSSSAPGSASTGSCWRAMLSRS